MSIVLSKLTPFPSRSGSNIFSKYSGVKIDINATTGTIIQLTMGQVITIIIFRMYTLFRSK